MAYVTIPKDLTKVKSKVLFGLTKRQLICFGAAALIGVPLFFLLRRTASNSAAAFCMIIVMLPFFLLAMYEADLMALTEDGEKAETPIVCTCTEKCLAGAVNTACQVCVKNLSECVGTEQKAAEPPEPENPKPEKKSNTGAILAVLLILAAGGGAAVYFLVLKPKQGKKVPADLDDFDLEDEEEYLTEDEETEEKNE